MRSYTLIASFGGGQGGGALGMATSWGVKFGGADSRKMDSDKMDFVEADSALDSAEFDFRKLDSSVLDFGALESSFLDSAFCALDFALKSKRLDSACDVLICVDSARASHTIFCVRLACL